MTPESEFSEYTLDLLSGNTKELQDEYSRLMADKPRSQHGEQTSKVDGAVMAQAMENLYQKKHGIHVSNESGSERRRVQANTLTGQQMQEVQRFVAAATKKPLPPESKQPPKPINKNVMVGLPNSIDPKELKKYQDAFREAKTLEEKLKKEGCEKVKVVRNGKITIGKSSSQLPAAEWIIDDVDPHLSRGAKFEIRRVEENNAYRWVAVNTGTNEWLVEGVGTKLKSTPDEQRLPDKESLVLQLGKIRVKLGFVQDRSLMVIGLLRTK